MGLADELSRLQALHDSGALSDHEFAQAKARVLAGEPVVAAPAMAAINQLRRSLSDRWIGGVCGGLVGVTGIDSWIWRLMFALLFLFGGTGLLIYLLMWIFVPSE